MMLRVIFCLLCLVASKVSADEWDVKHLGFSGIPIQGNDKLFKQLGFGKLPTKKGLLVAVVNPDTPTATGGLLPLAIVSTVNRKPVGTREDVSEVIAEMQIGDEITLGGHTLRNNAWKSASVKTKIMTYRAVLEASIEKSVDNLNGHEVYQHKFSPKGQEKIVQLYVQKLAGNRPQLRVEAVYGSEDWLFLRSVTVANGQARMKSDFAIGNATQKVKGGYTLERNSTEVPLEFGELIVRPETVVRLDGTKTYYDHEPTISEIWINKDVLEFYRMISSSP